MTRFKLLSTLSVIALLSTPLPALSQSQPDPHHPDQGTAAAEIAPTGQGQQDMMMNMMGGMMKMMGGGMMGQGAMTGQGGMDMQLMGMTRHVEGRIAFLRAELQITGTQAKLWDAFADALRQNAKGMTAAGMPMMASATAPGLVARLDAQERMLAARLDGLRAMKAALAPLYDALNDQQRKAADDLLSPHVGLMAGGMMGSGMMGSGMMGSGMGNMQQGGTMPMPGSAQQ